MICRSSLPKMHRVVECYGYKISRHGYMKCPFHNEKTPSLKIYPEGKGFYCFGCGAGGSVIDFVMKLFSLDFHEALKRINNDFGGIAETPKVRRKIIDINKAKETIKKNKEHKEDIEFRQLWLNHKKLRKSPPHEEFWDNLEKLLNTEDFKYDGI